jgi:translation elongation factor EF-4
VQAAIGGHIIARENVEGAAGKNVLAKCYGARLHAQAQAARKTKGRKKRG